MRSFAFIFGIIFLIIGIAGFIPDFVSNNRLAQVFHVNIWLNSLHVVSGAFGLIVGFINKVVSRLYFQIIGVLYAILAILGFVYGTKDILGIFASNTPDTWFHVIIAIAALVLGYGARD